MEVWWGPFDIDIIRTHELPAWCMTDLDWDSRKKLDINGGYTVNNPAQTPDSYKTKLSQVICDSVLCGGVAGSLGIAISQPLDVIRVRLQTNYAYNKSIRHCANLIIQNEGVRGLWKGVCSPVLGTGMVNALLFCGYETVEYICTNGHERKAEMKDWVISGAFAGAFAAVVTSPTELIARRAQVDVNSIGTVQEEVNIIKNIWRSHGLPGLYQGLGITAYRDALAFIVYFSLYKSLVPEDNNSLMTSFWAGGLAGSVSWGLLYPIDVIKTRWQVLPKGAFPSPMALCKYCYKNEGPKFLFQGLGATVLRAFPQHAVTFLVYESATNFMTKHGGL